MTEFFWKFSLADRVSYQNHRLKKRKKKKVRERYLLHIQDSIPILTSVEYKAENYMVVTKYF